MQEQRTAGFNRAVDELGRDLKLIDSKGKRKTATGLSRGNFACAQYGTSYGNGQGVSGRPQPPLPLLTTPLTQFPKSFYQSTDAKKKAWRKFIENPFVQAATDFVTGKPAFHNRPNVLTNRTSVLTASFNTWAPNLCALYNTTQCRIFAFNAALDKIHGRVDSPFASMTVNFGPQTVCWPHRDTKNLAYGLCAIVAGGSFDHRRGGHLILHEFRLVLELRAGDTLFLPSAVVTHQNVAIGEGETRTSVVYYSAGGLFRWAAADGRTHGEWMQQDPEGYAEHEKLGEERWREGWNLFTKYDFSV